MNKIAAIKFVDTMQIDDPFYCCNLILKEKQKVARQSNVGYFTFAKSQSEASKKLGHLINKDTNKDDPFTMWDYNIEQDDAVLVSKELISGTIEKLMKKTEDHQRYCIKKLKTIMKKDSNELVGDEKLSIWTYLYASKRQYHLFDPDGAAIEDRNYLQDVLQKYANYLQYGEVKNWFKNYSLYFSEFVVRY